MTDAQVIFYGLIFPLTLLAFVLVWANREEDDK